MAASVDRPPAAYSRPVGGNPGPHFSGLTSSVQPDLGPYCSGPEPGFSSHLHQPVFVPPAVYTNPPPPPPPPFFHYQWPTPFPFPPLAGYPGRSFGMVVPTPPYLEAPAYILPHPHVQPVDYRRLLPPQVPAPYPNQTRRTRLPYVPRETVNSEVQTEMTIGSYRARWPPDVSDSGRGTGSNTSHSPGSSSPKQDLAEGGGYENGNCVQLSFTGMYIGSGVSDSTDNEEVAHATDGEALFKVLRLPHTDAEVHLESWETVGPVDLPFCDRPSLNSREDLRCSVNSSCMFFDGEPENSNGTNSHYDLPDMAPCKMSSSNCPMKQKLNESIWSVESLEPFIPSREWLLENGLLEPETNKPVEEARKDGLSAQSDEEIVKADKERRQSWRWFSMSVQMSEDGLDIKVQDEEQSPPKPQQDQSSVHSDHHSLSFSTPLPSEAVCPPTDDENDKRSSEPEAAKSPNQEALIRDELPDKSPFSQEEMLQSLAEKISLPGQLVSHTLVDGAPVTLQKIAQMLPSKSHLMDFGVQCSKGQEPKCFCGLLTYRPNKNHHLNIQMSGKVKLKLSGSMEMCRKGLVSGGRPLEDHTKQDVHSGYD